MRKCAPVLPLLEASVAPPCNSKSRAKFDVRWIVPSPLASSCGVIGAPTGAAKTIDAIEVLPGRSPFLRMAKPTQPSGCYAMSNHSASLPWTWGPSRHGSRQQDGLLMSYPPGLEVPAPVIPPGSPSNLLPKLEIRFDPERWPRDPGALKLAFDPETDPHMDTFLHGCSQQSPGGPFRRKCIKDRPPRSVFGGHAEMPKTQPWGGCRLSSLPTPEWAKCRVLAPVRECFSTSDSSCAEQLSRHVSSRHNGGAVPCGRHKREG